MFFGILITICITIVLLQIPWLNYGYSTKGFLGFICSKTMEWLLVSENMSITNRPTVLLLIFVYLNMMKPLKDVGVPQTSKSTLACLSCFYQQKMN